MKSYCLYFSIVSYLCCLPTFTIGANCPNDDAVACLTNPCENKTCSDDKATCVPNNCGGCNAVFYDWYGENEVQCEGTCSNDNLNSWQVSA